jgi:D-amino-acid oxidase
VSASFSNAPSTYSWLQFHEIPREQLKPGIDNGTAFTSVCINPSIYLPWLVSQCLKAGVVFKRANFQHISDAADIDDQGLKTSLVVNCTGLSASRLGGVEDKSVIPSRGQIVVVRNDPGAMLAISGTDDADDEVSYIMMRAAGGGTILGGSYQKGNWESQFDPNLAIRIMKRCVDLCPQLTGGKGIEHLDIIRHGVGLRPLRLGGARIEKEKIGGTWVVHNYGKQPEIMQTNSNLNLPIGHGGFGYQSSYGCAQEVVKLVDDALKEKARL